MRRSFVGWRVVGAVFVLTLLGFGSAYSFASFVAPLQAAFGMSRSTVSLAFGFAGFLYFALGAVTGPLSDRIGARPLIAIGVAVMGGGLWFESRATSTSEVLAGYAFGIGIGVGCIYVPALGVVQRWFVQHRGLASGFAVSGIGMGTLAYPPLAEWLISEAGWRQAYFALGIVGVVAGSIAVILLCEDPASVGQFPDGAASMPNLAARSGISTGEAIRSAAFGRFYIGMLLIGVGAFVPFVHLLPYAIERGASSKEAVALIALIGVGSTAGRFTLGGWADRICRATAFTIMCVGMAAATGWWAIAPAYWGLVVFALTFGLFYGGWVALAPALAADLFGGRHAGGIIGILYTSVAIGTFVGPYGAGLIYDRTGSYLAAILASAALALLGGAAAWPLARIKQA